MIPFILEIFVCVSASLVAFFWVHLAAVTAITIDFESQKHIDKLLHTTLLPAIMDDEDIVEQPIYAINEKPFATPYTPATDYHSQFRGTSTPIVIDNGNVNCSEC